MFNPVNRENKVKTMRNIFNFSAGPAMLPEEVLLKAQSELLDWHGSGMSIMELSHRGSEFKQVAEQAEADLRDLMSIPANYKVLFLGGGATTQFAMVPLNLFGPNSKVADYVDTGVWSKKAIAEASRYGMVNIAARTKHHEEIAYIPPQNEWTLQDDAVYLHYTPNETIDGIEFNWVPKTKAPLVADMTSMLLSRPINVNDYGIIYAGAQKNISNAGLTVVIIRDDLIKEALPATPTLYSYKTQTENHSLYNTPPTFSWYLAGLVFAWLKEQGGVGAIYEVNKRKAKKLYAVIDAHKDFYHCRIDPACRSMMNVMFYLHDESLTPAFLAGAEQLGLTNLRGHRVSGGVRASIYNAMPEVGVDILANYMVTFLKQHG